MLNTKHLLIILIQLISFSTIAQLPEYIDDRVLNVKFETFLTNEYKKGNAVEYSIFNEQIQINHHKLDLLEKPKKNLEHIVQYTSESSLILGRLVEKDGKNIVYKASAFLLSPNGICVTNYHVFEGVKKAGNVKAFGVMDYNGDFYMVTDVLAASKSDDIALFKINTNGNQLPYITLGNDPDIGSNVHIVSHPGNKYFTYSYGKVTRKYIYRTESSNRISISAEFIPGSSGAAVVNDEGEVIGVVSSIFPASKQYPQVIVKEIIPVSSLKKLIE